MFRNTVALFAATLLPLSAYGQDAPPYECDDNFGQCGTPNQSGGGGGGGGGAILVNNTDLGDTYQRADDYDDDGLEDPYDNCPRIRNVDQIDSDGDGFGDVCDNCLTTGNPEQLDLDADHLGDACDGDLDGDLVANSEDNCGEVPNPQIEASQPDVDGDGVGDARDPHIDGAGRPNLEDPCPLKPGAEAANDAEREACFPDGDGDGVGDLDPRAPDNCVNVHNPEQLDLDGDGKGDACDPDADADGILNLRDNCPGLANPEQGDADRDGLGDACDELFCYTVFGDRNNCLDPVGPLQVYSPGLIAETGSEVRLRLFANRRDQAMRFTWRVVSAPKGSSATVDNARGAVSESVPFEYLYRTDAEAMFAPDVPGEYVLELHVETIFEDAMSREVNAVATWRATLVSEGEPASEDGCSSVPGAPSHPFGLALLAFLGLGLRLRRALR